MIFLLIQEIVIWPIDYVSIWPFYNLTNQPSVHYRGFVSFSAAVVTQLVKRPLTTASVQIPSSHYFFKKNEKQEIKQFFG